MRDGSAFPLREITNPPDSTPRRRHNLRRGVNQGKKEQGASSAGPGRTRAFARAVWASRRPSCDPTSASARTKPMGMNLRWRSSVNPHSGRHNFSRGNTRSGGRVEPRMGRHREVLQRPMTTPCILGESPMSPLTRLRFFCHYPFPTADAVGYRMTPAPRASR